MLDEGGTPVPSLARTSHMFCLKLVRKGRFNWYQALPNQVTFFEKKESSKGCHALFSPGFFNGCASI